MHLILISKCKELVSKYLLGKLFINKSIAFLSFLNWLVLQPILYSCIQSLIIVIEFCSFYVPYLGDCHWHALFYFVFLTTPHKIKILHLLHSGGTSQEVCQVVIAQMRHIVAVALVLLVY